MSDELTAAIRAAAAPRLRFPDFSSIVLSVHMSAGDRFSPGAIMTRILELDECGEMVAEPPEQAACRSRTAAEEEFLGGHVRVPAEPDRRAT